MFETEYNWCTKCLQHLNTSGKIHITRVRFASDVTKGVTTQVDKHFIVLNGKRYDAVTGAFLGLDSELKRSHHKPVSNPHASRLQPSVKPHTRPTAPVAAQTVAAKHATRAHHGQPKIVAAHRPEPAKTLMRHAVQKPERRDLPTTKRQYPLVKKTPGVGISPKISVSKINSPRSERAARTPKSQHVGKFHPPVSSHRIVPQVKPLAVASAPVHAQPTTAHKPHKTSVQHAPSPAQTQKTKSPQAVHREKVDIFEKALAEATSHEQPKHKVSRHRTYRRLVSSLAALGAVLVIGGFVTYMNRASVQLQVASVRAGFQASMPSYSPQGFERQAASTQDKKVAISFVSPTSNQAFTLTQESSDWDSQTLFDSLVSVSDDSYQTVQSHGRTIYIYGDGNAAWVDGGILYQITGNASLSSDQIISLASSM